MEKIAAVRIRGKIRVDRDVLDTLDMLRLYRQNFCSVFEKTPSILGMLQKVKDYIAWGEISEDTIKEMLQKRGEKDPKDPKKYKPYFRLQPPRGGFERKGIKKSFTAGGVLGYRGAKINDLIKKMI
jgi:large subunit ribosomal protein L30